MPKNANEKPALAGPRQTHDRDWPTPDQDNPGWPQPAQMEKYFLLFRPAWASQPQTIFLLLLWTRPNKGKCAFLQFKET